MFSANDSNLEQLLSVIFSRIVDKPPQGNDSRLGQSSMHNDLRDNMYMLPGNDFTLEKLLSVISSNKNNKDIVGILKIY